MNYKISVIIPIFNSELYLERCLSSLFKQNFDNIQYVFIDDASTDNSLEVLSKFIRQYESKKEDCVVISQKQNRGISFCRQLGIKVSSGEYIAFCDSDDYIEPEAFEILYKKAVQNDADLVAFGYYVENGEESKTIFKSYGTSAEILKDIYSKSEIALWDKLFKRALLIDNDILPILGLDYYEDCYMTVKAIYYAKNIVTLKLPFYHYLDHPGSFSKRNMEENLISMKYYIEELEKFFKNQNINPSLHDTLIKRLKFQYKLKLKDGSFIIRKDWKNIYKECHSKILKFKDIPFLGRLKLYFLINLGIY